MTDRKRSAAERPRDDDEQSLEDLLAADRPAEASERVRDDASDLDRQLTQAREQVLRAQAELENFRKRARRDMEEERRFANLPIIADLLDVIDNLRRAIESAEKSESGEGLLEGVKMVADQLGGVLRKYDCLPIEAEGAPFDPNLHQAIARQPTDDVPPGTVTNVAATGYRLHERVVRPSQVIVSVAQENQADERSSDP